MSHSAGSAEVEYFIWLSFQRMLLAPTPEAKRQAFSEMAAWVKARSPERVREMEIRQGLLMGINQCA